MDNVPNGAIGLAVSGGSDSLGLLVLAADWARKRDRTIKAVTVDHGLREAAAQEADSVAQMCQSMGVHHEILRWDGVYKGNLQDAARRARQRLIGEWAQAQNLVAVATGHTRDDQAETFLLRLARGSGVDGLSAMADRVVKDGILWIRPVLQMRRVDLQKILQDQDITWINDPSNEDTKFARVKMRNALKELGEIGLTVDVLADTADRLGMARKALEQATFLAAKDVAEPRMIGSVRLDRAALATYPSEVQLRVLAHTLQWVSGAPYRPRMEALKRALEAVIGGHGHALSGCLITHDGGPLAEVCREAAAMVASDAQTGAFDGRWICEETQGEWRPLGEGGLAQRPDWRETAERRMTLLSSPSLWYNNELKSVPFVDKYGACECRLRAGPENFFSSIVTH